MHKVTLSNIKTCVRLEQELGLARGAVKQINTFADGTVQILFDKAPTDTQKTKLQSALNMKIDKEETV